ncbi:uncharacterized protein LOC144561489 [Carex rostrata]
MEKIKRGNIVTYKQTTGNMRWRHAANKQTFSSIFGVFSLSFSLSFSPVLSCPVLSPKLCLTFIGGLFGGATMASQDKGRPLPKFGEWDVNNPASAEGFTVIFQKARDEKKPATNTVGPATQTIGGNNNGGAVKRDDSYDYSPKARWFCCV